MKLRFLTVKNKILLMLFWEIGALLLLFFVSQFFMERNNSLLTQIEGNFVPALELGRDMEQMLTELQRAMQDAVAAADQDRLNATDLLRNEFLSRIEEGCSNPFFEKLQLEELRADFLGYYVLAGKSSQALIEGRSLDEELLATLGMMRTQYNSLKAQVEMKTVRAKLEVSLSFDEALRNTKRSARLMNIIIIACTFVFGALSFFLSRSITGPLHNLVRATNMIAKGDLSHSIAIRSGDELSLLGIAMERMRSELQQFYQRLEHLVAERTQQLQESEARFRHVIASISDHIYMSDLLDAGQRIHRYLSPNIAKLSGYPAARFLDDPSFWESLVFPEDRGILKAQEERFLQAKNSEIEYRLRRADGKIVWLRDSGKTEKQAPSEVVTVYGVISDISERKQTEEQQRQLHDKLRQSQKLEAIGKLAGGTAHEFNNILAIMLGAIELVMPQLPETSSARAKLEQAYKSGERGQQLVKGILIFSRSSQQKMQAIQLLPVLQNAIKMVRAIVPPGIELRCDLEPIERPVLANPLQIEQIIINLCKNAIEALPAGEGIVELNLDQQELHSAPHKYARLCLKDNGSGMSAGVKEQIFDPFFTTKEVGQGSGLGLSVVHGIIQQHGGQIRVESKPGQGTTFEILLPFMDEVVPLDTPKRSLPSQTAARSRSVTGDEHILIIDHDSGHLRLPVMALEKLGYTVTVISENHDALEMLRHQPERVHLVMLALASAEEQEIQFYRDVVTLHPEIPMIVYAEPHTASKHYIGEESGNAKFLQKPLKVRLLIQTIREMLAIPQERRT